MEMFSKRWLTRAILIVIFVGALLPRLLAIGRYITPDEMIWVFRSVQFREAVLAGTWADTMVSGHPGVVTTWLGMWGISLQMWLHSESRAVYEWITHLAFFMPENMVAYERLAVFLTSARLLVALVNSLGVTAVYLLVRRLWGNYLAWLAALLLALDPFVAGLSGILHVDALMTTFATLALLSLLATVNCSNRRSRFGFAILAGVMTGLAVLSKTPAMLLGPLGSLLFIVWYWQGWRAGNGRPREIMAAGILWVGAAALTIFATYPALWTVPYGVWELLSSNANRHIEEALRPSFFLGQVGFDLGPLFYPLVLLFRLSPVVLTGLIFGAVLGIKQWRQRVYIDHNALFLLLWAALYIVGISFAAKKFDRYALAIIPALTIMAAGGWTQLRQLKPAWKKHLFSLLLGVQALYLIAFIPYPLAAYNPFVGGPWVAESVLPLGWGEAVSAAGRWLAAQPDASEKTAVTGIPPALVSFFPGQTLFSSPEASKQADYLILTANSRQAAPDGEWPDLASEFSLLHTIRYGGLAQAWIYSQPNPEKPNIVMRRLDEPVIFGGQVALLAAGTDVIGDRLDFWVRWQLANEGIDGRYTVKISLKDEAGQEWAGREIELTNAVYFYPEHWADGEQTQVRYSLRLPPGMPPAQYRLQISIFDGTGAQMPLLDRGGLFQGTAWRTELFDISIPVDTELKAGNSLVVEWLVGDLILRGYDALPPSVVTGDTAVVDLYWHAAAQLPADLTLQFLLDEQEILLTSVSRFDTGLWQPGQEIHEKYSLTIPPKLADGVYPLSVAVAGETAVPLGEIEIIATDRLFQLPEDIAIALDYRFNDFIVLRGVSNAVQSAQPGETVGLTLYWQTEGWSDELISAFVHVVGQDGLNVTQVDQWPGGLPSSTRAAGEVIVDEYAISLPVDAPPGIYQIAVGLYTADNGVRLPAIDGAGAAVLDNRVMLPFALIVEASDE